MKKTNSLKDILQSAALELEHDLSLELDKQAKPTHNFSKRYLKQKQRILNRYSKSSPIPMIRWRILVVIISLLAILTFSLGFLNK